MIKDNTINKKLSQIIVEATFRMAENKMTYELQILSDDLLKFYAEIFCNGNLSKAKIELNSQAN